MRTGKSIELSGERFAYVSEIRVTDGLRVIRNLGGFDLKDLLDDKLGDLIGLLGDCVQLPDGENFVNLGLADAIRVIDGLKEVNADFLELAANRMPELLALMPSNWFMPNAADSSNEGTPTSSTTAGDSSSLQPTVPTNEVVSKANGLDNSKSGK